jgi:GT2 family glycosyltransferase
LFLKAEPNFAIACGRRRERYPQQTIYNKLCDMEWDTPIGEAIACGGDALIRVAALNDVEGYKESLIAGEEPEMCFRMRQLGWKIMRLDHEMTWHDAAMTSFSQWWKRHKRAGHAYAESYYLHRQSEEGFRLRENCRILIWSLLFYLTLLLSIFSFCFLVILLAYFLQILRLTVKAILQGLSIKEAFFYFDLQCVL